MVRFLVKGISERTVVLLFYFGQVFYVVGFSVIGLIFLIFSEHVCIIFLIVTLTYTSYFGTAIFICRFIDYLYISMCH